MTGVFPAAAPPGRIDVRTVRALFTRSDYDRLPEGFPAQLVSGSLVKEPSPTHGHQSLVVAVLRALLPLLPDARVNPGPVDVPIGRHDVFQPDVAVYGEAPPSGASGEAIPAVVFEVLSPTSRVRDRGVKRRKYLAAGVREVWTLDPLERVIEVWTAAGRGVSRGGEPARSEAILGFSLVPERLFGDDPPSRDYEEPPDVL
jgi:Uma2 family endonuclease